MNLQQWLALADSDQSLPAEMRKAVHLVQRLALARNLSPAQAAAEMAKALGLTAGAIEALRAEQDRLMVTMMLEFNRDRPGYKQESMQEQLAANFGVTARAIRRWREQVTRLWWGQGRRRWWK